MNYDAVRKSVALMHEAQIALAGGPADFYLRGLLGAHDYMMRCFSPFRVGDRVTLLKPLDPDKIGDWKRDLHFLKPGSPARIVEAWADEDGFQYYVEFDNESWIDREGIPQPVSRKSSYRFGPSSLEFHPKGGDK